MVYRVWAPDHLAVQVVTGSVGAETRYVPLERDAEGFFTGRDERGRAGDLYWYQLDERLAPDPASRFQPQGVEGPSQVVDPEAYQWQAKDWQRPPLRGRTIYELHIGTFTPEGTFRAAIARLDALVELGVNTIEIMPVGDFAGRRNWGYDGVMIYAPSRAYGTPDDLCALVDAAHMRGLAVVLDVVYNHLGPVGNMLPSFSRQYFHQSRANPWGSSLNFDGEQSGPVRQFFLQNACAWLDEYRIDGLRLDAVHAVEDASTPHIIVEVAEAARVRGAFTIAEDERNDARIVMPRTEGGWGVDGMWADDFHHTLRVALTGHREAHLANYSGKTEEWADTLRGGWLYRGQYFPSWKKPRGSDPAGLSPEQLIFCISNHDQVGNRPLGERLHEVTTPAAYRAASMLLCLAPFTPLLFMGQEWAARARFPFFTDLPGEVGEKMAGYRLQEFQLYQANYGKDMLAAMPDPQAEATFRSAKLDWTEREKPAHAGVLLLYRECLRLRAQHAIFQSPPRSAWSVQQIGESVVALRWRESAGDWLLLFSLAEGVHAVTGDAFSQAAVGLSWRTVLASEDKRFGGQNLIDESGLVTRGPGALLLREV